MMMMKLASSADSDDKPLTFTSLFGSPFRATNSSRNSEIITPKLRVHSTPRSTQKSNDSFTQASPPSPSFFIPRDQTLKRPASGRLDVELRSDAEFDAPATKKRKSSIIDSSQESTLSSIVSERFPSLKSLKEFFLKPCKPLSEHLNGPNPFISLKFKVSNPTTRLFDSFRQKKKKLMSQTPPSQSDPAHIQELVAQFSNFLSPALQHDPTHKKPAFTLLPELSSEDLGGCIIFSTDDFYGSSSCMLKSTEPAFKSNKFTHIGRYIDGWETQRRLQPVHDWCLIQLCAPGKIYGCQIDTTHFEGNHAPFVSVEAGYFPNLQEKIKHCYEEEGDSMPTFEQIGTSQSGSMIERINLLIQEQSMKESSQWRDIVPMSPLRSGKRNSQEPTQHFFNILNNPLDRVTHLRLNLFPDGGLARFKAFGVVMPDPQILNEKTPILISSITSGGVVVSSSSEGFTDPRVLIKSNPARSLADCWETERHVNRRPFVQLSIDTQKAKNLIGEEWVVLRLGARCIITRIEIDTSYCFGNTPESILVRGVDITEGCSSCFHNIEAQRELFSNAEVSTSPTEGRRKLKLQWRVVISRTSLRAGTTHVFTQSGHQNSDTAQTTRRRNRRKAGATPTRRAPNAKNETIDKEDECQSVQHETFEFDDDATYPLTHICASIYPDGALARIRVWGIPQSS